MLIKFNKNQILFAFNRNLSSLKSQPNPLTVIKIPKYLKTTLNKVLHNEEKKVKQLKSDSSLKTSATSSAVVQKLDKSVCIISSNNKKFNHYFGQTYRRVDNIPLISKEWRNGNRTDGSRMRFHIYADNPSKVVKQYPQQSLTFDSLGLKSRICEAIESMTISEPTAIQMGAIPSILDHKNIICTAETGSGKTIAYLAPIIQMIREFKELKGQQTTHGLPLGLVIVPSRELAEQVGRVAQHLGMYCGIGVAVMMGGIPKHLTHTGMDLIISTIGLVEPLIQKKVYSLQRLNHLVVDESDTLFDDTFGNEVLDLLSNVLIKDNTPEDNDMPESGSNSSPSGVQLVCVSATMPRNLSTSLGTVVDIKNNFEEISTHSVHHIMPHVKQDFYRINRYNRSSKLLELVKKDSRMGRPVIIFSNRTDSSNWVHHYLNQNGIPCLRLNKSVYDKERYDQLQRFQSGECDVISCTDLGSRGLDTVRVRHVINYDSPHYVSDYIHRSGRTGRIGTTDNCLVSSFISYKPDLMMLEHLELALRLNRAIDSVDANIKKQLNERQEFKKNKRKVIKK